MRQINPIGVTEYCKCPKCKGQIDYEIEHILDPQGLCISRFCAAIKDLIIVQNTMPEVPRSNAEFELKQRGVIQFYTIYFNAPLDPYIKPGQVHDLFSDIIKSHYGY